MTTVKFTLNEKNEIVCFTVSGHSGYAEEGSDIVCAAVSSCVQMLEILIAEVIGEKKASFNVKGDAEISYLVPRDLSDEQYLAINKMLNGFRKYIKSISEHYKDYLSFETEVKKC